MKLLQRSISVFVLALLSPFFQMTMSVAIVSSRRSRFSCRHNSFYMSTTSTDFVSARKSGFALVLDQGTKKSHSMAENSAFVTGFFRGLSEKETFAQLVASLYYVYSAMEAEFDKSDNQAVRALDYPSLRRVNSLEKDLIFYFGDDWRNKISPSRATQLYINHIKESSKKEPLLLIAHQYTRYLGDLFGGQMMGSMASRSFGLDSDDGIKFYKFDEIRNTRDFIEQWYATLNSLELSEEMKQAILDEANEVFRYNVAIFSELEGNNFVSIIKLVLRSLFQKNVKN